LRGLKVKDSKAKTETKPEVKEPVKEETKPEVKEKIKVTDKEKKE